LLYVLEEVDDLWSRFGAVADMMVLGCVLFKTA